jgi:hypothetical protein
MERELRLYQFEFVNGVDTITIEEEGRTPCAARNAAFTHLEEILKERAINERQGWRLKTQRIYFMGQLFPDSRTRP